MFLCARQYVCMYGMVCSHRNTHRPTTQIVRLLFCSLSLHTPLVQHTIFSVLYICGRRIRQIHLVDVQNRNDSDLEKLKRNKREREKNTTKKENTCIHTQEFQVIKKLQHFSNELVSKKFDLKQTGSDFGLKKRKSVLNFCKKISTSNTKNSIKNLKKTRKQC